MSNAENLGASSFYFPISKVDDEQRMVWGYGTTPTKDVQGERISLDAVKKALPDYLQFRNIREMHRNSAVGVAKEVNLDADGLYIGAKIVDDDAWKKVKEEVYKGFSVGGERLTKVGDTITELRISEISLVDRPANPDCRIEVFKVADGISLDRTVGEAFGQTTEGDDSLDLLEQPEIRKGFRAWVGNLVKREFSDKKRQQMAAAGTAEEDGSYPIANESDLHNAIRAFGRSKNPEKTKAHIKARARAMGMEDALPDDWKDGKSEKADEATTVEKRMDNVVSPLAQLFQSLDYVRKSLLAEAQYEGDPEDKAYADRVRSLMLMVGELIKDHTEHEMKEEKEEDGNEGAAQVLAMADEIKDIEKRFSNAHRQTLAKAAHHIDKAMKCFKSAGEKHDGLFKMFEPMKKGDGMPSDISDKMRGMCKEAKDHLDAGMDHMDMAAHYVGKASGVMDSEEGVSEIVGNVKTKSMPKADEPVDVKKNDEPAAADDTVTKLAGLLEKLTGQVADQQKLIEKAMRTPAVDADAKRPRMTLRIGKGGAEMVEVEEQAPHYETNVRKAIENAPEGKEVAAGIAAIIAKGGRPVNDPTFRGTAGAGN